MTREPYEAVEKSISESGHIVDAPSNGEAIGTRLNDSEGGFHAYLIEWAGNDHAWISGDNNVPLNGET